MRILISAYACAPGRGSEPGVGWNWATQVARVHDVWVLVPENHREAVESWLSSQERPGIHCIFCDLPEWIRPSNKDTTVRFALHYYLWQFVAWQAARRLEQRMRFDVVHHITLGAYWKPSLLCLLPAPFLLGPVGGGETLPKKFWTFLPWQGRLFEFARLAAQRIAERDPLVLLTARRSALALVKTAETGDRLRAMGAGKMRVMSEAGMCVEELDWLGQIPIRREGPFRLISLGRLLHWKGFELSLRAFAQLHRNFPDAEYWLVGDGPARKRLMEVARRLDVAHRVQFPGHLPRLEAVEKLADCDVLAHPSLHDSGGWVCLEAMSAARPVVCLDAGGPGAQVTAGTGIKVRPESPGQVIGDLARAFELLAGDPELRVRLGVQGRARVREVFAWDRRRDQLLELYAQLAPGGARERSIPRENLAAPALTRPGVAE